MKGKQENQAELIIKEIETLRGRLRELQKAGFVFTWPEVIIQNRAEYAESIINTVREPLVILNADLIVVSASRSFYLVFEVEPEETEGKSIYELGNRQWDIPKLRELLDSVLPQHKAFDDFEVDHDFPKIGRRTMLLNGRWIPRETVRPQIVLLAIEDITAREKLGMELEKHQRHLEELVKERTATLEVSEVRFRRLFEAAKEGILILDAATGKIIEVNPFLIEVLGYSREELLGKELWEIGSLKDIIASKESFLELQCKEYLRYDDLPLETKDGHKISVEFICNVYTVDHDKVVQCSIRDVTERKQMQDELKEKMQDLERFSKFAVDRELKMEELEKKVKELEERLKDR